MPVDSAATAPLPVPTTRPARNCDVVMKGGVTSGVVYPLALVELARTFALKNIGGTSAGAIAAAAAAAAEAGRATGGYERLADLPRWLGESAPGCKNSNLFALFQPQPGTRALFSIATAGMHGGSPKWATFTSGVGNLWPWALLGAMPGFAYAAHGLLEFDGITLALGMMAAAVLVAIGALLAMVLRVRGLVLRRIPANFNGLCNGMSATPGNGPQALTEWLTDYLNDLAGKPRGGAPLTFRDLWWPERPPEFHDYSLEPTIRLEMISTCVSHGRPYRLPFRNDDTVHENSLFAFSPEEFRQLFPDSVVQWMVDHASKGMRTEHFRSRKLVPLPEPCDLPVVVAARMSLSFPGLLSMVPLWAVDYSRTKGEEPVPERCWFSDGGLCSNFPVHFFDAPLPRWPTFAINLEEAPPGRDARAHMHSRNSAGLQETWLRFVHASPKIQMRQLLGVLFRTVQTWNDSTLTRLPGQRDRIATVTLNVNEGGLNLNMPPERIMKLAMRGREAAVEFVKRFATEPNGDMGWANHRWIRMRTFLMTVQELIVALERACSDAQVADPTFDDLLSCNAVPPSYAWNSERQREIAQQTLESLRKLAATWKTDPSSLALDAPRPRSELRPRPRL